MNVGDTITEEPTVKGVILKDRGGDYWAYGRIDGMQRDCWEIFCADPAAARHYSERAETTPNGRDWDHVMRYGPLTVVELGEAAASPRFILGQAITEDPRDANVILRGRRHDRSVYLTTNGAGGWDWWNTLPFARRFSSTSGGWSLRDFQDVTFVEYVSMPATDAAPVNPADITDLSVYKQFVRDKVISEAERRGWCDEVDGWLKELGLEPRPVKLPEGIGSTVHLKDDQGVAIRVLPPSSEKEWQWVRIMASRYTSSARTSWVQQHAATVNSDRDMMA